MPHKIFNFTLTHYKDSIILFGGIERQNVFLRSLNSTYKINLKTLKPEIENLELTSTFNIEKRSAHTASIIDNKMYIIGGWTGNRNIKLNIIISLDLDKLIWEEIETQGEIP